MVGFIGVTVMDETSATVIWAALERLFNGSVAVIVVVPPKVGVGDVARPIEGAVLLIVATVGSNEVQLTACVQFIVVPSESVAVAAYCCVVPVAIVELVGVTVIDIIFPPLRQLTSTIARSVSATAIQNTAFKNPHNSCLRIFH